jgi:adenylate cyclase
VTPEGIKKEKDVDRGSSITGVTSQKLNGMIIGLLVLALGYFAFDKFVLDPGRDAAEIDAAVQTAHEATPVSEIAVTDSQSIAVLPFVNMSSDAEQEYFSDGLSEELLNLLAKVPELRVAARTSSFSFKGQNIEIPEIASRLGVANVLEGSVRKSGDQIRITAQLIHAEDGFHLWSETWDRNLDNIFQIQDEIAAAVVDSLKLTLLGEAPKSTKTDPEAYRLFLEAQYFGYQRTGESMDKSIDLFKQSIAIDAQYAPAWAEMAYTYQWHSASGGMPIAEGTVLANQAIDMALSIDPEYGFAYFVRGVAHTIYEFNFVEGAKDYRRAMELEPGNALITLGAAWAELNFGRFDHALEYMKSSLALNPVLPDTYKDLALTHWYMGDSDLALSSFQKLLALSPDYLGIHHRIARVYIQNGNLTAALEHAKQDTSTIYGLTGLAMVHFALGDQQAADAALGELIEKGASDAAYQIAEVYGMRGDADKVFEWLEESYQIRDSGLTSLLGDPSFSSVWADPRWDAFLEKLKLAEIWRGMPPEWGGPQS